MRNSVIKHKHGNPLKSAESWAQNPCIAVQGIVNTVISD